MSTPAAISQTPVTLEIRWKSHSPALDVGRLGHRQTAHNWAFTSINWPNLQPKQPKFRHISGCGNPVEIVLSAIVSMLKLTKNWLRFVKLFFSGFSPCQIDASAVRNWNAVRAGIVAAVQDWEWGTAPDHLGLRRVRPPEQTLATKNDDPRHGARYSWGAFSHVVTPSRPRPRLRA